jgi:hypothetical protein
MTLAHEASRTLVKSPPELWAELSDATSLSRHLQQVGDIRITRLEPETAVAWEGERASGTVRLEPSGWGTRVIMTARMAAAEPEPPPAPKPEPTPEREPEPEPAAVATPIPAPPEPPPAAQPPQPNRRSSLFGRLFGHRPEPPAAPEPEPPARRAPEPEPPARRAPAPSASPQAPAPPTEAPGQAAEILAAALDSLGQAHHRPFSRG